MSCAFIYFGHLKKTELKSFFESAQLPMLEDSEMNESANSGAGNFRDGFVRQHGREQQDISTFTYRFIRPNIIHGEANG